MRKKKVFTTVILLAITTVAIVANADPPGDDLTAKRAAMTLKGAITALQPGVDETRADRLAKIFKITGEQYGFDPKFIIAIAFRESSLIPSVENRRRFGKSHREIGLMQCHGAALSFRPAQCSTKLEGAWCQIQTGTRYLAHIRDNVCSGSTWRLLAAYGHGRCMSAHEAKNDRGVRRVMRYYQAIGGRI